MILLVVELSITTKILVGLVLMALGTGLFLLREDDKPNKKAPKVTPTSAPKAKAKPTVKTTPNRKKKNK
jgi:hypothetical protein